MFGFEYYFVKTGTALIKSFVYKLSQHSDMDSEVIFVILPMRIVTAQKAKYSRKLMPVSWINTENSLLCG